MDNGDKAFLTLQVELLKQESKLLWDSHNKNSKNRWDTLSNDLCEMKDKINEMDNKMTCDINCEKIENLMKRQNRLYQWFMSVIILGIVLGLWINVGIKFF